MVRVAAPLSWDSCIVICGSYFWLSFKAKCTMKQDSNNFNSLDHADQHRVVVPQLMPVGLRTAQCRQPQADAGQHRGIGSAAHPRQSRAPLPGLQPLLWVLWRVQPRFPCAVFPHCSDSCWCTVCYGRVGQRQPRLCAGFGKIYLGSIPTD